MKKIMIAMVMLLLMVGITGCTDAPDEWDVGFLGGAPDFVEPMYIGPTLTGPDHEFTNDEFSVIVCYDDGSHREVTDFEITSATLYNGMYTVYVEWRGLIGDAFVFVDDSAFYGETETVITETSVE